MRRAIVAAIVACCALPSVARAAEAGLALDALAPMRAGYGARALRIEGDAAHAFDPHLLVGGGAWIVAASNNDGDCKILGRCFHRHLGAFASAEGRLLPEAVVDPWARVAIGPALLLDPYENRTIAVALATSLAVGLDVRVSSVSFGPRVAMSTWSWRNPETFDLGLRVRVGW